MTTPKRIIVTRPYQQAQGWIERITQAGYTHAYIPSLAIIPVDESREQAIKNRVMALDEYDFAIFVSQNAVTFGFEWIEQYWPQFPVELHCLSVGAKTHALVQEHLTDASYASAQCCDSRMNSEALLAMPELQGVENKKILIFRGLGGRTKLSEVLQSRGAQVDYCELYERSIPQESLNTLCSTEINTQHDILTIFSGESLKNFHTLVMEAIKTNTNTIAWQEIPTVVPSIRVKEYAHELGFRHVYTAENASEEAMWETLQHLITT